MLYYRIFTKDSLEHIFNANLEKVQPKSPASKSLRKKLDLGNEKFFWIGGIKKSRSKSPSGVSVSELETINGPRTGGSVLCWGQSRSSRLTAGHGHSFKGITDNRVQATFTGHTAQIFKDLIQALLKMQAVAHASTDVA